MKLQTRGREEPDINLTSLIDVVLLLLVFFMVSTSFVRESEIRLNLPEASESPPAETEQRIIEITVTATGTYLVDGRSLVSSNAATLRRAILAVSEGRDSLPVIIRADAEARHQAVVTAMDVAGRLGHSDISIATVSNPDAR
ncbi:MAG: biopolymer transporter ExbD [Gammaproteobacteria bacterium]|nr:biopolymer transporter ExbD [Gammaproteobacteria bacterium]